MTPHVSCVMCNLEANYTLHKKPQRKNKCCTNSDDAILEPESKFVSTLTFTTAEELEVHDFNAQSINELVDQFKQQLAAIICGSVRGQSKSMRTKSEAQKSAQFQDQNAKNQSTPAVKSNFEQNLDVQAH
ncbi:hypothetical protein BY996DRAFT_6408646 [Phakopsora pachyrhizi]|nr:hypothetical protein BY996DRAFT_6408646 [Phakopsora pachyrhizi]